MRVRSTRVPPIVRGILALTCAGLLGLSGACTTAPTEDTAPDTSADANSTAEVTPAPPIANPTCDLASPALIKQKLGIDVSAPTPTSHDSTVECAYSTGTGGHTVTVRFDTEQDHAAFVDGRHSSDDGGEPTSEVSGAGDEAYSSSVEFGDIVTNTLVARKGAVQIQVIAVATIDAEKSLVTALFAALT